MVQTGWKHAQEPKRAKKQTESECMDCLKFQTHTPVEKWKKGMRLKYCTFHYWMMRGRRWFTLEEYVERSRYFGFVTSLPSPDDMAKMMGQEEMSVSGSADAPRESTVHAISS